MTETPPAERPPEVVRVEVTPGKVRQVVLPAGMTGGRVVQYEAELEPVPGQAGLWREVRRTHVPLVKLTDDMEGLVDTGLTRRDVLTAAYAGFITGYRPGLQTTLVDPASVWTHIRRTRLAGREAAAAWWTRERIRAFSEASQDVVARGLVSRDVYKEAREAAAGQSMLELL